MREYSAERHSTKDLNHALGELLGSSNSELSTSCGSDIRCRDESPIMYKIGTTYAKDPPTTVGRRVPNNACKRVLMPETNSIVCITRTLSPYVTYKENKIKHSFCGKGIKITT